MFFPPSEYKKQMKVGTRCMIYDAISTLEKLQPKLSNIERKWFEEHPQFEHIFHMKRENNHKVQAMWMLLVRTAETNKKREVWFVVNGVPIRYGLREHALLSGLDCHNYPLGYKEFGEKKFVQRHFKDGEPIRLEDVKAKLVKMGPHKDRLKMAVLFFLGSVICAQTKVGKGAKNVLEFFQRAVDDLDFCQTFPWGRYSFDYMLKEIGHTMDHFKGVVPVKDSTPLWPIPGFCVPLEILAFEAIPKLANLYREPVEGANDSCPRMCKSTWKPNGMKGMSLSEIYNELGHETEIHSIIPIKYAGDDFLLDEIMEEEDDVDQPDIVVESWEKNLDDGATGKTVFFKDMFDEDIEAREKEDEPTEDRAEGQDAVHGAEQVGEVMKTLKKMMTVMKRVEKKVDQLDGRLAPIETFVKEAGKQKGRKT